MAARILVVDDLLPNRRLLEAKLKSEYYEVDTAENGKLALEAIKKNPPDIVLLDVMMPEMDGFEACQHIKENPDTAHIPVVMVTALSDPQDRVQGLSVGADDFLTKPINDLALFARIRSLVRLKNMLDELMLRGQTGLELGLDDKGLEAINVENAQVLVMHEDSVESQRILERLNAQKIKAEVTDDPHTVVRRSEEVDYDLIMVSSDMTKDDALHLCTHLRTQEKTRNTPILLIIDEGNTDLLVKAFDLGINDYLIEPVDTNEMQARVVTQVKRKRYQDILKKSHQQNMTMAVKDGLTGLYNRRYFDTHLRNMMGHASKTHKPLGLLLLDIDHFKFINDRYGHLAGDEVLKQLAPRIQNVLRATDLVARYGGEEFCVIMPDTPFKYAKEVAMRIRKSIINTPYKIPAGSGALKVTVSMGLTMLGANDAPEAMLERADKALYMVKERGRNNIAVNLAKAK